MLSNTCGACLIANSSSKFLFWNVDLFKTQIYQYVCLQEKTQTPLLFEFSKFNQLEFQNDKQKISFKFSYTSSEWFILCFQPLAFRCVQTTWGHDIFQRPKVTISFRLILPNRLLSIFERVPSPSFHTMALLPHDLSICISLPHLLHWIAKNNTNCVTIPTNF